MCVSQAWWFTGCHEEKRAEDMPQDFISKFGAHPLLVVASPSQAGTSKWNLFSINHCTRNCSYDVTSFIEKDTNLVLDATFVLLLLVAIHPIHLLPNLFQSCRSQWRTIQKMSLSLCRHKWACAHFTNQLPFSLPDSLLS